MKIVAAILTRNQYEHDRRSLFEQTVESFRAEQIPLYVVDNGSTDGTDRLVQSGHDWTPWLNAGRNTTSGFGTWTCCRLLAATDADLCVVSDDDMQWTAGWTAPLIDWWQQAPDSLVLTGGHIEPAFPWNQISSRVVYGNTIGLLRESTGAASWTWPRDRFERLARAARMLPIDRQGDWDVPMCRMLTGQGNTIGQVDVADHAGVGRSTWGNRTEPLYGWDVDAVREQLR